MAKKSFKKDSFLVLSDGTSVGTRVINSEGKSIGFVTEISWAISIKKPIAVCKLTLIKTPVTALGKGIVSHAMIRKKNGTYKLLKMAKLKKG